MFGDKLKKMFNINKKSEVEEVDTINEEKVVIGNDKKKIENLVFFVVLLIITILIINFIWNGNNETNKEITNDASKKLASGGSGYSNLESGEINSNGISDNGNIDSNMDNVENLENKLKNILSKIQGVGEVDVCLNYSESSEVVAMYNENSTISTTEETDDSGGVRKIEETDTQKDVIFKEEDGNKTPITTKVIQPKIEGAIITAQGVNNAETKNNIILAVEAVTGLATHKIQVFEMNN